MDSTARLELLSRTEAWDECFQQGVHKTSAATVTSRSYAKLFAHIYTYANRESKTDKYFDCFWYLFAIPKRNWSALFDLE
jgi:hypothetical protein